MADTTLERELKTLIISTLNLEDLTPEDIESEANLFGSGLGLDSIDALELGVALQKRYGITIDGRSDEVKGHFRSVRTLAAFVLQFQGAAA